MKKVIFYISGHGFGHSSRMAEVIKVLLSQRSDLRVIIKTSAPEWFFREYIQADFEFCSQEYDTGVIQADSLNLDPLRTLKNYAAFIGNRDSLIRSELTFIREVQPRLIVGDIPPIAFELAARASLPSLAVANFSWDWIYEPYLKEYPEFHYLFSLIQEGYHKADLLLRLPFAGNMPAFQQVRDIPLIARQSPHSPQEIKKMLSLPRDKPLILLSFGGFGLGEEYYQKITKIRGYAWIASERVGFDLPEIRNFKRQQLRSAGLGYPDLVKAADIVITKPGYGILSECIGNQTKMLYTTRGNFREYAILVEGVQKYLPCRFIPQEKLKSGDLKQGLSELLEAENVFPPLPLNGAQTCTQIILDIIN